MTTASPNDAEKKETKSPKVSVLLKTKEYNAKERALTHQSKTKIKVTLGISWIHRAFNLPCLMQLNITIIPVKW